MVFRVERDGYLLQAQVHRLGEDLVVLLGGGELPHVGTAVVAEPRASGADPTRRSATSSVWNRLGHKDEALARPLSERLAADLRKQGFAAFLSQLSTDSGQLHRVRIGPQKDRESAEAMAERLEKAGYKGKVLPHP